MAIKFREKGDEPEPAEKAPAPPPPPEREPDGPSAVSADEPQLPFAKPVRPEKKRKGR